MHSFEVGFSVLMIHPMIISSVNRPEGFPLVRGFFETRPLADAPPGEVALGDGALAAPISASSARRFPLEFVEAEVCTVSPGLPARLFMADLPGLAARLPPAPVAVPEPLARGLVARLWFGELGRWRGGLGLVARFAIRDAPYPGASFPTRIGEAARDPVGPVAA